MKSSLLLLAFALPAAAQIIPNPQVIQGTVRFANIDPSMLAVLGSGGEGMTNRSVLSGTN